MAYCKKCQTSHLSEQPCACMRSYKRSRNGHNHVGVNRVGSKINYVMHGKGFVVARHPGCRPFVLTEQQWLEFPIWEDQANAGSVR